MARRSFSTSRRAISASASARSISPWFRLKTGSGTETLVPTWLARSPDTWNSLCVYCTPSVGFGQRSARARRSAASAASRTRSAAARSGRRASASLTSSSAPAGAGGSASSPTGSTSAASTPTSGSSAATASRRSPSASATSRSKPRCSRAILSNSAREMSPSRARLAHAHRLPVVLEVLARQAEALRRFEERHEARAQLEGEPALEIRALGRRRLLPAARRRHPRTPLARKQDLLLEPDLGHDRVTHADAARVRLPEGEVAGSRRERRVRQEAGRDHIAVGRTHVQRAGEQLGVLPAQPGQRLVERQAHRVLPAGCRAEGQHEREHEPAPPHRAPPRLPGARVTRPPPRGAPGRAV